MPRLIVYGMSTALILAADLSAQSISGGPQYTPADASPCELLQPSIPHSDSLRAVCQYAVSIPQRMPNFTCQQETSRLLSGPHQDADTITGFVTYEDGKESYKEVKRNGRAVSGDSPLEGAWSAGQFGSDLQSIFDGRNKVEFHFVGERNIEGRQGWEFTFRIAHQDVALWRLRVPNQMVAPPYYGRIWIDQRDGLILRLLVESNEMPPNFPIRNTNLEIDYENILFTDGTRFVLPVKSVLNSIQSDGISARNIQRFQNCRKFASTSRIVPQ